jgi:hypothetical protein
MKNEQEDGRTLAQGLGASLHRPLSDAIPPIFKQSYALRVELKDCDSEIPLLVMIHFVQSKLKDALF